MDRFAALDAVARPQQGCFTMRQAVDVGFPPQTVDEHATRGVWVRRHVGVFSAAGTPRDWLNEVWAAYLALASSDAVVFRRSAARLWRLPGFDRHPAVELLAPRDHTPSLRGVAIKRTIHLPDDDIVLHSGLRTTSVTRTLHDLAAVTPTSTLLTAAAEGYRLGRTDPMRLLASVHARRGLPGNRRLREVIAQLDHRFARTRSVAEIVSQVQLASLGVHHYEVNVRTTLSTGRRVEFDLLFPGRRVLEINGARYHGTVLQRRHDAKRRAEIEADGYVLRELWADELHDRSRIRIVLEELLTTSVGT